MRIIFAALITLVALSGCTQIIRPPKGSPEPYRDLNSYLHGNWILLAESSSKDWYYDPESVQMDEDGPISFWLYWKSNATVPVSAKSLELKESLPSEISEDNNFSKTNDEIVSLFEPSSVGPYLQKIDCLSNTYLEESLIDGRCESVDISNNSQSIINLIMRGAGEALDPELL